MSVRYGIKGCRHKWRHRKDGLEEQCIAIICIKCGAFGCTCDIKKSFSRPSFKKRFYLEGQNGNANINGKWENPYV